MITSARFFDISPNIRMSGNESADCASYICHSKNDTWHLSDTDISCYNSDNSNFSTALHKHVAETALLKQNA